MTTDESREGWHVHDTLKKWGQNPRMLDTTRIRQIGVGQHRRRNDAIDAEVIALAWSRAVLPRRMCCLPSVGPFGRS
ncbi:MAG: hypothetical protein ABSF69_27250 [Polyangiaceae bacterium]|jgi:hypothetical protein